MVSWVSGGGVVVSEGARPEGSKEVTMDLFWVGARAADARAWYSTGCRWPVAGPCVSAREEPTRSAAEPRATTALLPLRGRGLEMVLRTARPAHRRGARSRILPIHVALRVEPGQLPPDTSCPRS